MKRTGRCMCGKVAFTAETEDSFGACHCKMCQRWASGVFMGVWTTSFELTSGAESLSVFHSSDWAERAFCPTCGSNIYYRLRETGRASVALGLFDDTSGLTLERQMFTDLKPDGFDFANATDTLTSAEAYERFGVS